MEKTSVKQEKRFHIRLLRFFAVLILGVSASAFGKTPSPQEIRSLVVEPDFFYCPGKRIYIENS